MDEELKKLLLKNLEETKQINDKPLSEKSIDQLLKTTENTEKYLTPTLTLNIKKYFQKLFELKQHTKELKFI